VVHPDRIPYRRETHSEPLGMLLALAPMLLEQRLAVADLGCEQVLHGVRQDLTSILSARVSSSTTASGAGV